MARDGVAENFAGGRRMTDRTAAGGAQLPSATMGCVQDVPGWTPFARAEIEQTVFARFERIADANAERTAVVTGTGSASYRELNNEANRIAHSTRDLADGTSGAIATLLDSDLPLAAAMLAIVKLGRLYVPIDPRCPVPRGAFMLDDVAAQIVLTEKRYEDRARQMAGPQRVVSSVDDIAAGLPIDNPGLPIAIDTPLWVMYTSGSTGQPKGVVQTHRNLLHYVRNYANGLRLAHRDRLLALMQLTVNGGCHDALMSWLTGATLQLWNVKRDGLQPLADWMAMQRTTILSAAPTVFRHLSAELAPDFRFATVRMLKLWAEPVYRRDFDAFCRHFRDDAVLVNRLGSNEQGSTLWYFLRKDTKFDGNDVPVGYPTEDNAVRLVDDDGNEVPSGQIGEIVACSRYLSPGYWKRDELTRAVFSRDGADPTLRSYRTGDVGYRRADGCLVCVGRKDSQIKIRGYRVETAEIERVLLTHPGVAEAVVIGRADPRRPGEQRLVAYFTAKRGHAVNAGELRKLVASQLPDPMWPSAYVRMEHLPQSDNGKVARRALPEPSGERPELDVAYRAATTDTERALTKIWTEVLQLADVGVDDPFLDLGGDSLQAAEIALRVRVRFAARVSVADLLIAATIAAMAMRVDAQRKSLQSP